MKVLKTILIFTLLFVFTSCVAPNSGAPKNKEPDYSKIDKIEVTWGGHQISLSDEQMEYVISLLQEGEWKSVGMKINPEYHFNAGEFAFYCDLGSGKIVNTPTDRTLHLSDEQIDTLKSYFQTVSADAIAEITVGMTYSQVCSILLTEGTVIEYPVSSEVILQYNCEDGSKYNVVFFLGDGTESTIVTGITKVE